MKIIKNISFIIVLILFLFLPFLRFSKIFLNPVFVTGKVNLKENTKKNRHFAVKYKVNDNILTTEFNKEYINTEKIKLVYQKNKPENIIIFSFIYLYLSWDVIIPFILFFIIAAIFFSDNQTAKKIKPEDYID